MRTLLDDGTVRAALERHLRAQGSNIESLQLILQERRHLASVRLASEKSGYWYPADLTRIKDWVKRIAGDSASRGLDANRPEGQVGVRLLAIPGQEVSSGEEVVEVRYPRGVPLKAEDIGWLKGQVLKSALSVGAVSYKHLWAS